jgi:hypothetical protein
MATRKIQDKGDGNIKMNLIKVGWDGIDWIGLSKDKVV